MPASDMSLLRHMFKRPTRRHYEERGYCIFRGAFPVEQIKTISQLAPNLIAFYDGELRRQDGNFAVNDFFPGTRLVRNPLLHAHASLPAGLDALRMALCSLVTSPSLGERLRELDGVNHYTIHQTLLFFAAQTTEFHLDSWSLDTAPRGRAHTVWIPLQDMDHRSGLPSVLPWPCGQVVTEADLGLQEAGGREERYDRYHRALRCKLLRNSPEAVVPLLRMGDFVVWSSLTPHFTLPAQSFPAERLSLQILIRPADNRWGDFLSQPYDRTSVQLQKVTEHFSIRVMT
jgi:hypothetical protein